MKWGGQQKECVKRRAELSVQATPGCSDRVSGIFFVKLQGEKAAPNRRLIVTSISITIVLYFNSWLGGFFNLENSTRLLPAAPADGSHGVAFLE